MEITQERVNLFAEATGDHQWIHVDVERATKEIGGRSPSGYLTLSLIPFLGQGMLPLKGVTVGINYGSDKVRFINMVRVGKRVRMRQKLIGAEPKAGGMRRSRTSAPSRSRSEAKPARPASPADDLRSSTAPWPAPALRGSIHHLDSTGPGSQASAALRRERVLGFSWLSSRWKSTTIDARLRLRPVEPGRLLLHRDHEGVRPERGPSAHDRYSPGLHHVAWSAQSRQDVDDDAVSAAAGDRGR